MLGVVVELFAIWSLPREARCFGAVGPLQRDFYERWATWRVGNLVGGYLRPNITRLNVDRERVSESVTSHHEVLGCAHLDDNYRVGGPYP